MTGDFGHLRPDLVSTGLKVRFSVWGNLKIHTASIAARKIFPLREAPPRLMSAPVDLFSLWKGGDHA